MMKKRNSSSVQTKLIWKDYSPRELYELSVRMMEERIAINRHNKIISKFSENNANSYRAS